VAGRVDDEDVPTWSDGADDGPPVLAGESRDVGSGRRSALDHDPRQRHRSLRAHHDSGDERPHTGVHVPRSRQAFQATMFRQAFQATMFRQAFQATMLLYTGVTMRVPEFVVAPPYAWTAKA